MTTVVVAPEQDPTARSNFPAHQSLTLFGDYWWEVDQPLPTGAIVGALGDLGVKEPAARAALARLVAKDLLSVEREGRRTLHLLTDRGRSVVADEAHWLTTFGVSDVEWDGQWSILMFTAPESMRSQRNRARTRLRWRGYAPLYDGVWISPFDTVAAAEADLEESGIVDLTSLRGQLSTSDPSGPLRAWDVDGIRDSYEDFIARSAALDAELAPPEALVSRMTLMLAWQTFRQLDPGHPLTLLPPDWPRGAARRLFVAAYNGLGDAAEERMREHVRAVQPGLESNVTRQRLRETAPE